MHNDEMDLAHGWNGGLILIMIYNLGFYFNFPTFKRQLPTKINIPHKNPTPVQMKSVCMYHFLCSIQINSMCCQIIY